VTTLSLVLLAVSGLAVVLAGFAVYSAHVRLTEIRDVLVDIRDEFK
jgi:hypothetical protein